MESAVVETIKQEGFSSGVGGFGKPGSGKKTLKSINTNFYVGTEVTIHSGITCMSGMKIRSCHFTCNRCIDKNNLNR